MEIIINLLSLMVLTSFLILSNISNLPPSFYLWKCYTYLGMSFRKLLLMFLMHWRLRIKKIFIAKVFLPCWTSHIHWWVYLTCVGRGCWPRHNIYVWEISSYSFLSGWMRLLRVWIPIFILLLCTNTAHTIIYFLALIKM